MEILLKTMYSSVNADDGKLNFDGGDVFDATQKIFSEIDGTTDGGVGVNLSFIGSTTQFRF